MQKYFRKPDEVAKSPKKENEEVKESSQEPKTSRETSQEPKASRESSTEPQDSNKGCVCCLWLSRYIFMFCEWFMSLFD